MYRSQKKEGTRNFTQSFFWKVLSTFSSLVPYLGKLVDDKCLCPLSFQNLVWTFFFWIWYKYGVLTRASEYDWNTLKAVKGFSSKKTKARIEVEPLTLVYLLKSYKGFSSHFENLCRVNTFSLIQDINTKYIYIYVYKRK